jgi:hypothetical protein
MRSHSPRSTSKHRPTVEESSLATQPRQALLLQRAIGNQRTRQVLQRAILSRQTAAPTPVPAFARGMAEAAWGAPQIQSNLDFAFNGLLLGLTQLVINGQIINSNQVLEHIILPYVARVDPVDGGMFEGTYAPIRLEGHARITMPPPPPWEISMSGSQAETRFAIPRRLGVGRTGNVTVKIVQRDAERLHTIIRAAEIEHAQDDQQLFMTHIGGLIRRINQNAHTRIRASSVDECYMRLIGKIDLIMSIHNYILASNAAVRSHDAHNHGFMPYHDGNHAHFNAQTGVVTLPMHIERI